MGEPSYEKQFEEDLERAQALSLESLALEEFKNRRDRELREKALGNRNVSVTRASSMTEKDGPEKYLRQQPKPRPRPGTTGGAINMSLIAPPPSSSRKNSTANESPDLISFSSPPPPENNSMIEFCNSQNYNNNSTLSSFSTSPAVLSQPKMPFNFNNPQMQRPHLNLGMFQPSTTSPRLHHPQMGVPAYGWNINTSYNLPNMSQGFPNSSVMSNSSSPITTSQGGLLSASPSGSEPLLGGNFMSPSVGGTSSGYSSPSGNIRSIGFAPPANQLQVPALPPKNQHRTPPPIAVPSSKSAAHRTVTKRNSHNLIDLAHSDQTTDKNSVRVSILQEFDPILSTYCDYGIPLRTKSPECSGDDTISICESVYDEYDPYDFITTGSGANSVSDPIYAAVIKSEAAPHSPVPPLPPRDRMTTLDRSRAKLRKGKLNLLENIVKIEDRTSEFKGTELYEFYTMVKNIRKKYKYNDPDTNMGLVMSPMVDYQYKDNTSIKLVIYPDYEGSDLDKPIAFTCDVTTSLEHVTLQAVYECEAPSNINYTLKVWGSNEYLAPTTLLSDYEYVLNCLKLEDDVLLSLIPDSKIDKSFARTEQDDFRDKNINFEDVVPSDYLEHISYENLKILLETLESEIKKLEDQALEFENNKNSSKMPLLQPSKVTQSVKCVINFMNKLCTLDVIEAVDVLQNVCNNFITDRESTSLSENISNSCNKIKIAVLGLVDMYCAAYRVNFKLGTPEIIYEDNLEVQDVLDPVMLRLCAIYRPEIEWKHDNYIIAVQIYHGKKPIGHPILTQPSVKTEQDNLWPSRIMFNQMIQIDDVSISSLARESRLVLVVYGRIEEPQENNDSSNAPNYKQEEIGWTSVQFFDYEGTMVQGGMLLSIWPKESSYMYGPAPAPATHPDPEHSMLGIEITELGSKISFPSVSPDLTSKVMRGDFSSLDIQTQQQLLDITEQDMLAKLPSEIREVLWDKRHYLYNIPEALPKVLLAAHSWESSCLPDLHGMLQKWTPLKPIQALELVLPTYPDIEVRKFAVKWFSQCPNDALIDYLPQLVVALKHETYENSTLAQFLLDQSLRSPRFAHYLFWLLSHNLPGNNPQNNSIHESLDLNDNFVIAEARYHRRSKLLLRALLAICGEALRNCFLSQQMLVKELNEVAENVQKVKESHRQTTLINAMQKLDTNLMDNNTSLPLSPTLKVAGIQVRSCYYFPSNTLPLKINFIATDKSIISAIYKVGDDLQQDMLTLQMVRIMEKLWLKKGLDLKIVSFACIPTGKKRGMIEMVSKAETLRKIQVEHGLTGSFKDKPIAEWLAKHNPSELEYERAVQNFTASCAGYCVATYILGICDRHNDNIMLKTSGHLFHIDFGKFLGDAQMFGNFKRDRAPFVLTSDMAYVINGGDRPSEKFHSFVDLCCQAFNIVRDNGNLFLYLLTLMVSSGMCGVTSDSVNYLRRALLPEMSNPEAAAYFARLIQSSLKSWFTQFNFFLHNLAQLKFTGEHNENTLLSFVPKTYTKEMDGQIKEVQVVKYQKRYDPDKYYVYVLRVYREDTSNMAMEIQRTYKEFCELHQKLCIYFPLAKLHSLSNGLHVGRSNIKQVAEKRYHEVSLFVSSLFKCAKEIAHSDLVYTFFHPLLRDQQNHENYYRKSKDRLSFRNDIGMLKGQLKLSLHFSKNVFRVMVYHARGLGVLPNGQEPSTYVKVYLEPDNSKSTKRKTKVVKRNCHPSFMEMLEYRMTLDIIQSRFLKATVWNYDALQENEFLGGIELDLSQFDLTKEITEWYPLVNLSRKPA